MANDGGHLLLSDKDKHELVAAEPGAAAWVRPFMQVDELLYDSSRWCLWLSDIPPAELARLPRVAERVAKVRQYRTDSKREATQSLAAFPSLFGEIRQPSGPYLIVPRHTGEDRNVIPIKQVDPEVICGDANLLIADPSLYTFGIFESNMHMAWVRAVCGRIKSDYRYSAGIVYNNFPWPESVSEKQHEAIESAAQAVLDARATFPDSTLADLYDPTTMPPALVKAHQTLDRAVDAAYGKRKFDTDAERVAFLFERYQHLTSLLPAAKAKTPGKGGQ